MAWPGIAWPVLVRPQPNPANSQPGSVWVCVLWVVQSPADCISRQDCLNRIKVMDWVGEPGCTNPSTSLLHSIRCLHLPTSGWRPRLIMAGHVCGESRNCVLPGQHDEVSCRVASCRGSIPLVAIDCSIQPTGSCSSQPACCIFEPNQLASLKLPLIHVFW